MITLPRSPGVYRITDTKSGRFYVGSSVDIGLRWRQHQALLTRKVHFNPILQAIWGVDPHRLTIEIIRIVERNREAILAAEQLELDRAGVGGNPACMNVLAVAGSHLGRKRSDVTRRRLATANRGKRASVETRQKQRAAKLGRPLSAEHRRKLGDAARGKKINRPKGIYRTTLRSMTAEQVLDLREKRAAGMSWRLLAIEVQMNASAVKRAVLGLTYADVRG